MKWLGSGLEKNQQIKTNAGFLWMDGNVQYVGSLNFRFGFFFLSFLLVPSIVGKEL